MPLRNRIGGFSIPRLPLHTEESVAFRPDPRKFGESTLHLPASNEASWPRQTLHCSAFGFCGCPGRRCSRGRPPAPRDKSARAGSPSSLRATQERSLPGRGRAWSFPSPPPLASDSLRPDRRGRSRSAGTAVPSGKGSFCLRRGSDLCGVRRQQRPELPKVCRFTEFLLC